MEEVVGSIPAAALCTIGVVATYVPSKDVPRFRLPDGAFYFGSLAQMVERSLCMREVMGSMPMSSKCIRSTSFFQHFTKEMTRTSTPLFLASLAQLVERKTCNLEGRCSTHLGGFLELCLVTFIRFDFGQFFQYM